MPAHALKTWRHWKRIFDFFLQSLLTQPPLNKLVKFVSPSIYELLTESASYEGAIETTYNRLKNEVFPRHPFSSCKEEQGNSFDQNLQKLKTLAKVCNREANQMLSLAESVNACSKTAPWTLKPPLKKTPAHLTAEKQSLSYRSENITS